MEQAKNLILQTNYLIGGYEIIINKIKEIDNYNEIIPVNLRIDSTIVFYQIKTNLHLIEDILVPDQEDWYFRVKNIVYNERM